MKQKDGDLSSAEIRKMAEKRVGKRHDERIGLIAHTIPFVVVNLFVWQTWLSSGGGFPWPLFVTGGWGIGYIYHFQDYYYKYGPGRQTREAEIQAEMARQTRLAQARGDMDVIEGEYDNGGLPKRKRRLEIGDDGELIDMDDYAGMDGDEQRRGGG